MFGTSPRVNQLEAHKKLLIAESELNRAELIEDMTALREDVSELARRAKSMTSIAVVAAALVTGVVAVRRRKPADPANPKPSWLQGALKGASLVSTCGIHFDQMDTSKRRVSENHCKQIHVPKH